jgi:hypothetical protein
MIAKLTCMAAATALLISASTSVTAAHRARPFSGRTDRPSSVAVVKGRCTPTGRFQLTVQRDARGKMSLLASAHRLPDGSRWNIWFETGSLKHPNVRDRRRVHLAASGGAWSAAAQLKAFRSTDEELIAFGPHDRGCVGLVHPSWPKLLLSTCHGKESVRMLARRRPGDRLAVRSIVAGAGPGSVWTVSTSVTSHGAMSSSTEGSTTQVTAGRHGIVHTRGTFMRVPHPYLRISAAGPGTQRCSTSLRTAP